MIPAVDGLLPEPYNGRLLTLLYRLAEWHALAKLRMHTETTLGHLDKATTTIGRELRLFRDWTRAAFICKELPRETALRAQNQQRRKAKAAQSKPSKGVESIPADVEAKVKTLNLFTYKFHALGAYVRSIRLFGTTDSYSTQIVCSHWPAIYSEHSRITISFSGRAGSPHCQTLI